MWIAAFVAGVIVGILATVATLLVIGGAMLYRTEDETNFWKGSRR